jgi:hypothetical protein
MEVVGSQGLDFNQHLEKGCLDVVRDLRTRASKNLCTIANNLDMDSD